MRTLVASLKWEQLLNASFLFLCYLTKLSVVGMDWGQLGVFNSVEFSFFPFH